jgi:hypothetical protein
VSLPLCDFRGKITPETRAALEARSRAHGIEMQEIAREVLHEWALREIRAASLLHDAREREGLVGEGDK